MPEQWNNTKKTSIQVKQQVAPLQANEVSNIRRKSASFDVNQHKFREKFRQIPPFKYDCDKPYDHLDKVLFLCKWAPFIVILTIIESVSRNQILQTNEFYVFTTF